MIKKERLLALDVMRGITIAAMILVNNPGNWSAVYAPLRHVPWHGMTPTDLIYPFFMFIMGVSMSFSLLRYPDGLTAEAFGRILKRSLSIFAVGIGLHWISRLGSGIPAYLLGRSPEGTTIWQVIFPTADFRTMGVLQGLALAYLFGSVIVLAMRWKHILWAAGGILAAYWAILHTGNGYEMSENNIVSIFDRAVLGARHMYHETLADGTRIAFEPEGLLSTLPRIAHVIFGVFVGRIIAQNSDMNLKINRLFVFGTILLFAGLLWQYGDPINKKLWTASFTLTSCGLGTLLLALLIRIIDVGGCKKWSMPMESFGINPLFLYVSAWVASVLLRVDFRAGERVTNIKALLYNDLLRPLFGDYGGSLAYALIFVAGIWGLGYILYRKRIYIKL